MSAGDCQELDALEQWQRVVLCLLEDALLKTQKAQFAVVEERRLAVNIE
jgi:hypothetical protein